VRILIVSHGFPPHGHGGAELYAEACALGLAAGGDDVWVLAREAVADAPEYRVRDERRGPLRVRWINNTFRNVRRFAETYDHPAIQRLAAEYLDTARPAIAHVHHLTCLSTRVLDELASRKIPTVLTLHDYWMLCHRGQLFDRTLHACDGPAPDGCGACIGVEAAAPPAAFGAARLLRAALRGTGVASASRAAGALSRPAASRDASRRRLAHMIERWRGVDVALAPSRHVRDRFARAGFPADRIRVSEYGVDERLRRPRDTARPAGSPLRIGYLGALMVSKAPHVLLDAVAQLPAGSVEAHLYGAPAAYHGDDRYVRALDRRPPDPAIHLHGQIHRAELPRVLQTLDVLVFPSVWEETSGIGAREALMAGVPVVASRIGGVPELVEDGRNGLLVAPGDAAALAAALRRLVDEPELLGRLRAGIAPPRTLQDDVTATRRLYEAVVERRRGRVSAPRSRPRVAAVVLNYRTPEETLLAVRMLERSDYPLDPLVVVDNGPEEAGCRRALETAGARVTLLEPGRNLGFPGGGNLGIRRALEDGAHMVLLINSDLVLPPDAAGRLIEAMREQPVAGIAGPVVHCRTFPDRVRSAGLDLDPLTGRMRERRCRPDEDWTAVPAVSGCAMLIDRRVFERIGFLPEEYFFSFEDLAFCHAARTAGFDVGVVRGAKAYHLGGESARPAPLALYYGARNHLRLTASLPSHGPVHRLGRQLLVAGFTVAHATSRGRGPVWKRLGAVARGVTDHLRGRYGPAHADE
jgi:GT2 family glycosyltransferase/glycosyltransferase involved in cell wall biosynthesis